MSTTYTSDIKYLGVAPKFPIKVLNGQPVLSKGSEAVQEAIATILNTPIGSKFFLPEYGSRLHELMFEPNDEVLESLMYMFIKEAIDFWEKRVKFVDASFSINNDKVEVVLFYRVLNSNEIESFVYPYYRKLKY